MQKTIKLHDKYFEPFLVSEEIQKSIVGLAAEINRDYTDKNPIFIGVLNGCFLFFADLVKQLNITCEVAFLRVSSYQGTETTGEIKKVFGLDKSIKNRHIILVEDIVDTGITLDKITADLQKEGLASLKIATLLFKPKAYTKNIPIDYIGFEVGN